MRDIILGCFTLPTFKVPLTGFLIFFQVWDDELALLAENNVRSCDYEHDSCTTTSYFTRSGQNLIAQYKGQYYDPIQFIQSSMQTFFDEHKKADMSYVYQFRADNRL